MANLKGRLLNKLERMLLPWAIECVAYLQRQIRMRQHDRLKQALQYCAPGVRFKADITIDHPQLVSLGRNVYIGPNVRLDGRGGLRIGDYSTLGCNVVICTANHDYQSDALPYAHNVYVLKAVTIERNVWVGANVLIVPGVTIGEGAIIAAGTVVTKNVAPLAIVGGAAMRVIKYRNRSHYDRLAALQVGSDWSNRLAAQLATELAAEFEDEPTVPLGPGTELQASP